MATRRSDVLLHPVRLRIVLAMASDELTTSELAERLPDVAQATLYRHVAVLVDAGFLDVVRERPVRGAVEKTYAVNPERADLDPDELDELSAEEHLEAFTIFTGALIEAYGRYLGDPAARPAADGVGYRQVRLWLTDDELDQLVGDLRGVVAAYVDRERTPERTARLLSTVLMPEPAPQGD